MDAEAQGMAGHQQVAGVMASALRVSLESRASASFYPVFPVFLWRNCGFLVHVVSLLPPIAAHEKSLHGLGQHHVAQQDKA